MTASTPQHSATESGRFADQLERSFRGGAWHGPSITEALEGVSAARAFRRPLPAAHNIFELVFHIAFWIDEGRRRIEGEEMTDLPPEADWPAVNGGAIVAAPADTEGLWRAALAGLEEAHRRLHAKVLELTDERFDQVVAGSDPTLRGMLLGILQHNAYHAGQIALLARAGAATGS